MISRERIRRRQSQYPVFLLILVLFCGEFGIASSAAAGSSSSASLYSTLGLSKDCSSADIKKAYRKMALKYHPDKVAPEKRDKAEQKFKKVAQAYETLSDENKRTLYDQYGDAALDPQFSSASAPGAFTGASPFRSSSSAGPMPQSSDFFSFFQNNGGFGGSPFGSGGPKSVDLEQMLRKMMGENSLGTDFNMPRQEQKQRRRPHAPKTSSYMRSITCSLQDLATGATKKFKVRHPQVPSVEEIYVVKLKKGWKEGTKIKFPPRHTATSSAMFPAMTFVVQEKKHPFLRRIGNDLHYMCEITTKQAEKGARVKIPLPDGEMVAVTTESQLPMEDGHVMTVDGKGMPIRGGPERGNLVIKFRIPRGMESSRHAG